MRVSFVSDFRTGWPKGFEVQTIPAGTIIEMDEDGAKGAIAAGAAFLCTEDGAEAAAEETAAEPAAPKKSRRG